MIKTFLVLSYAYKFYSMSRSSDKMPNAVLLTRIIIRIIRTTYVSSGFRDFMFTSAFFAVVLVIVQSETIMTGAFVRSNQIVAFVLAIPVIDGAFVHICKVNWIKNFDEILDLLP